MSAAEAAARHRAAVAIAVRSAAVTLGFDPGLLTAIAIAESGLSAGARNPRSTATGPLQFTETTWLAAIARFGPCLAALAPVAEGLAAAAAREAALARQPAPRSSGERRARASASAALRRELAEQRDAALALRHDARLSALLAVSLAQEDAARFATLTRRPPSNPGETYAVHFLGVGAAADLALAAAARPARPVSQVLPAAVLHANREVFQDATGRPVSARAARERIAERIARMATSPAAIAAAPVQVAEAEAPPTE